MTPPDNGSSAPDEPGNGESPSGGVQSVDRSITILELLGRLGSASVVHLAGELGVHKSTASRLVGELEAHDLVAQHHERGKYELGFGILRLAHAIPARLGVVEEATPELRRLAETHRETVNLAVLRQGWAVNLAQEIGPSGLGAYNWIGNLTPPHATSSGKVLLSAKSAEERAELFERQNLEKFTDRTITSRAALEHQLTEIATQGYATVSEEWETGLNGIAVPVRDHLGVVVAALSISGPTFRFSHDTMLAALPDLKAAGLTVSRRLGYEAAD